MTRAPQPSPILLSVKAVPGAKRDEVVGWLGDRLKVRVAAPPEDGKANRAIIALVARELGVRAQDIEMIRGLSSPEKTLQILGIAQSAIQAKWPS